MDRLKIEIRPFGDNEESTRVGIYDQLGESRIIPEELAHPDQPQVGDLYCVSPDQCGIVTQVFEQPDWLGFSRFAGVELDSQVSVDTRVAAKAAEPRVKSETDKLAEMLLKLRSEQGGEMEILRRSTLSKE